MEMTRDFEPVFFFFFAVNTARKKGMYNTEKVLAIRPAVVAQVPARKTSIVYLQYPRH